jgi:hypothetical protein
MSISHHHTASGRPLRVAPAWVGAARPHGGHHEHHQHDNHHQLPVRETVWIWSVRRYARTALWALPAGALLHGWTTLGVAAPPGPLLVGLAGSWLALTAMVALAGLLAGSRTRRSALTGLLLGLAGFLLELPLKALPPGVTPQGTPITVGQLQSVTVVATGVTGLAWLLLGWAVFRSRLVNPADGVLLMLAAVAIGAGSHVQQPLPTVGALLLLAAGTGLAWTGSHLIPKA